MQFAQVDNNSTLKTGTVARGHEGE
jgi:hypothetical protein